MRASQGERVHIAIFGNTNSGKSTLLNYLTGEDTAIVSKTHGTTTDPIKKAMEIHGLGPVLFIDTAGINDKTNLSNERVEKSIKVIDKADIFLYLLSTDDDLSFIESLKKENKPIIYVAPKQDLDEGVKILEKFKDLNPIPIDRTSNDKYKLFDIIRDIYQEKEDNKKPSITGNLVDKGDTVVLVMPQDKAAPKDRLIKPQVMTIRELIDKNATCISTSLENFENCIKSLKNPPDLIITDSKVFLDVYKLKPEESRLTSFSVLMSGFKGDVSYFMESVKVLDHEIDNILIAEVCTHPPIEEDIGTVKIPKMLKSKYPDVNIDFARGEDFPDIEKYDLIIECGSCMFNRASVISRVKKCKEKAIPMTNYGITIAYLKGILDKIDYQV
ncbi:[FeFe] hydrogenase H-cluster maturation GTPase HydF [Anaerococcus sp.]|uniref:[FeFe] hydrogenase H-cluster maturation GTPase HydF n=1 Tax=Anaerococcus sp. TaxID=1872515 RepID=UPI0028FE4830|nr:[FeFe] hydrogenase H-cluster maturation GTPase HydF [Anaerococcus sp.]MDU1828752.1 [FeFe] hydrogenase H-cluster maturation GTPase HydF [Anaerococcus sp.]MDU1863872.1 [FeFe] hydrogenase H-cluster maturation GTPase HydF [Anaerococcus sp.]